MLMSEQVRHLSEQELAMLGVQHLAYVRPMAEAEGYGSSRPTARRWPWWATASVAFAIVAERFGAGQRSTDPDAFPGRVQGALSRRRLRLLGQEGEQRVGVVGAAQLSAHSVVAQQPRDAGQRRQMIGACA